MVRKRMVSTVMSLMMAAAVLTTVPVTNNVKAADKEITSGDYTYVKESNGKTSYAVLTSYRGSETNLVIPEELDGLQVKAISQGFEKNLKIKSIILSKNIAPAKETHRDLEVLNEIETLEEIRVAKDNLSYQAQDGVLYSKDKKQLFSYPKSKKSETYNMPASVKKVEEFNALINLKYLKNLTLSKNLSVTPSCNDSSIESVTIPGQIGGIDESSFENCNKLNKVTITKGLRFINDYAFFECKALKEIKLPEGLQSIGVGVFYRTGIKQLTIPGSVVKIDVIDKSIKLSKPSYLKKFKRDSDAIYYEARATIKASGKKAVTYKASRITKIKAKTSKVTIQKGKTTKLQTRVYISKKLKKGYLDPEILKFTTSNKKVVKVSSKGTIKGLKKGKATVTVKLRTTGKTYKVNVKVK